MMAFTESMNLPHAGGPTRSRGALISRLRTPVAAVCLLIAGCGGSQQWPGEPDLHGAYLEIEGGAWVYTGYDSYRPYLRAIIEATAAHFGKSPDAVAGLRISVSGENPICNDQVVSGCFTPDDNTIRFHTAYMPSGTCIDGHVLPHELLHYFLGGDPGHTSPLWADIPALGDQLERISICH